MSILCFSGEGTSAEGSGGRRLGVRGPLSVAMVTGTGVDEVVFLMGEQPVKRCLFNLRKTVGWPRSLRLQWG